MFGFNFRSKNISGDRKLGEFESGNTSTDSSDSELHSKIFLDAKSIVHYVVLDKLKKRYSIRI